MKLTKITHRGRYTNPETGRSVNVHRGRIVGPYSDLILFFYRSGKRVYIENQDFTDNWKKDLTPA